MKFLLIGINSKFIHSNPAIHYLKAYAGEQYKEQIELAEYTINHLKEQILADIYKRQPDVMGFSCYIWNFQMIQELLPEIAKVLPGREIWLGGPEVSFEGEAVLRQLPCVTGIIQGEGEETFRELFLSYLQHGDYRSIKGLLLREGTTGRREELAMDELPFLYQDLKEYENRIIYYETSRGCPYRCAYCLSSVERKVRLRGRDKVEKELAHFLRKKVPQVKFVDRTFNCNKEHALFVWSYIKEHDNGVTNFHFEVAADIMDERQLAVLSDMRPGLVQLEIGIQTTNEKTLREIDRYADTGHIAQVVERLQRAGNVHIHLDLIAGLPFEDYASFIHSFNQVYAMKPEQLQLGFLKILKGAPMYHLTQKYGIAYQETPPYEVLYTNWLSYEEVLKLKRVEEMVEVYYNSCQFAKTLLVLKESFESPFRMYEELAKEYEAKGYFVNTPSRSYRYRILLDFAKSREPEKEELFRELLTCDYYLRENAKSRPDFCMDLQPFYREISDFYEKEEKSPQYLKDYQGYHAKQMMKMTHMERFHYPVWEEDAAGIMRRRRGAYVLYDYQKRNPLTMDAKMTLILGENNEEATS